MAKLTLEQKKEQVKNLRPIDDVFFECLAKKISVVQKILRTIMQDNKLVVLDARVQNDEHNLYGRSVRLDALCTLGDGSKANIEVQRSNNDDHLRRVRFNAASITVNESNPGDDFRDILDLYVVYISEKDFLHDGKTIYHVDKILRETGTIIDDGQHEIFVNAQVKDNTDISELMTCFMQKKVSHPKFPALSEGVTDLKDTERGVSRMCDVMEKYKAAAVKEATEKNEKRNFKLIELLFANNRANDAQRVASDPQYREQLFIEFNL